MKKNTSNFLILTIVCILISLLSVCDGRSSHMQPLAGIFGMGGGKKEEELKNQQKQQPPPPFPPQQQSSNYQQRPPPPSRANLPGARQGFYGQQQQQQQQQQQVPLPPQRNIPEAAGSAYDPRARFGGPPPPRKPPPPPPILSEKENISINVGEVDGKIDLEKDNDDVETEIATNDDDEIDNDGMKETNTPEEEIIVMESEDRDSLSYPPPPPTQEQQQQHWGMMPNHMEHPPHQQQQHGWENHHFPPSEFGGWEQANYYGMEGGTSTMMLEEELNYSLARENTLLSELENMTAALAIMEQREELHIRQLDVLTERVIDVESQAAADHNRLVEYEANCTALGLTLATLQEELEEWQQRCNELIEMQEADKGKISELKRLLKEKASEAEDLAIAIENIRLAEKRREAVSGKRKQPKEGFVAWLLSFFVTYDDEYEELTREETFEMAKSTLLRALQSERSNVHELEAVVASLQQNNSAISEMVESRDSIIDELNNRIAVFEEDKVVLKAALRQLQKEIEEEAPKAQKLLDDLAKSTEEIERLKAETNSIIKTHKEEVKALQHSILSKQKSLSESESNLTAIGTYVDKLEERLTSFAITRRDMEERERKCKEIEETATVIETEKKTLEVKIQEYSKEQEDLKKLLEELAVERANLQKENRKLLTEREFRIGEQEELQGKCSSLENDMKSLSEQVDEWKTKCEIITPSLEAAETANSELRSKVETLMKAEAELEAIREEKSLLNEEYEKVQKELQSVREVNAQLDDLLKKAQEKVKDAEKVEGQSSRPPSVSVDERDVPFRAFRKKVSKVTGMHGVLTPSSEMLRKEKFERSKRQKMPPRRPPPPKKQPLQEEAEISPKQSDPFIENPDLENETKTRQPIIPPPPLPQ